MNIHLFHSFQNLGFPIVKRGNIYKILNSHRLSKKTAEMIALKTNTKAFFSQNRIEGNLEFVLDSVEIPKEFKRKDLKVISIEQNALWEALKSIETKIKEPVTVNNRVIFQTVEEFKLSTMKSCSISSLVFDFCDKDMHNVTALDLGSGIGVNALPLLQKNWDVVAVDRYTPAVNFCREIAKTHIEKGKLKLLNQDILDYSFVAESKDLIIAVDVLPLIPPKKLRYLMQKIHSSLVKGGCLIGTLLFEEEKEPKVLLKQELQKNLGYHIYPKEFIPAILENCGFEIEQCSIRMDGENLQDCAEFVAIKK
jgi:SAM-dependent methyltransferase